MCGLYQQDLTLAEGNSRGNFAFLRGQAGSLALGHHKSPQKEEQTRTAMISARFLGSPSARRPSTAGLPPWWCEVAILGAGSR